MSTAINTNMNGWTDGHAFMPKEFIAIYDKYAKNLALWFKLTVIISEGRLISEWTILPYTRKKISIAKIDLSYVKIKMYWSRIGPTIWLDVGYTVYHIVVMGILC